MCFSNIRTLNESVYLQPHISIYNYRNQIKRKHHFLSSNKASIVWKVLFWPNVPSDLTKHLISIYVIDYHDTVFNARNYIHMEFQFYCHVFSKRTLEKITFLVTPSPYTPFWYEIQVESFYQIFPSFQETFVQNNG